jgi:excisionase family DNA binding protein
MFSVNSPAPEPDEWFTPAEAAKYIRASRSFIYKLICIGKIPAQRLGDKLWRIRKSDLDSILGINK